MARRGCTRRKEGGGARGPQGILPQGRFDFIEEVGCDEDVRLVAQEDAGIWLHFCHTFVFAPSGLQGEEV